MRKTLLPILALLAVAACKKDETQPTGTTMQLSGTLSGANEASAVTTTGTGNVTGTYNTGTKVLTYSVAYSSITPTAGHFHTGAAGTEGPIIVIFSNVATSPITGTATLTQAQEDALIGGTVYANLHTAAYPGGEVRANVVAK